MHTVFRGRGTRAILSMLCAMLLAVAVFSGMGAGLLLLNGGYQKSAQEFYAAAVQRRMDLDLDNLMYGYFDPADPENPWDSYYSGSIYTGLDTNFLYRITDPAGTVVLSTWDGKTGLVAKTTRTFDFQTEEERAVPASETPPETEVTDRLFTCGGRLYGYRPEEDAFQLVEEDTAALITDAPEVNPSVLVTGFTFSGTHYAFEEGYGFIATQGMEDVEYYYVNTPYTVTCGLRSGLPVEDGYRELWTLYSTIHSLRYSLLGILAVSLALGLILLTLLAVNAGLDEEGNLRMTAPLLMPSDLGLAVCGLAGMAMLALMYHGDGTWYSAAEQLAFRAFASLGLGAILTYLVILIAGKARNGRLITGSLLFYLLINLGRVWSFLGRFTRRLLGYLPLIWKVLLIYGVCCLGEFIILAMELPGGLLLLWLLWRGLLGLGVCYVTLALGRLKQGAEAIAGGDYSAQVSKEHLVLELRDTADTLNHIRDGMNRAVAEQMRSERMKTELITNVSHDLKTPLTAIVSYVDLLKREPTGSAAAREYLEVLDRQSGRLKKLIEDLVEASKASTGNLALNMEPLDFCMLLDQAMGEYAQRLQKAELVPLLKLPEEPVMVRADGQKLWRVFDNLLGNAVKYAMPGTRLYLTVEAGETVTATFRNISREPLNVSPEELLERFVRGDESRHTEGSGLGLSIARSLVESMGGAFRLEVDGDLFKAIVEMPVLGN